MVGTRAAAFAPVHDLGLVAIWDDGDDLHAEPRAPYPHTRETLLLRAERERHRGAGRRLRPHRRGASTSCAPAGPRELAAPRAVLRERVTGRRGRRQPTTTSSATRTPAASRMPAPGPRRGPRRRSRTGPVLVQTPRTGYAASLACERCRTPARCATCPGPLALTRPTEPPACRWCAHRRPPAWACPECGHRGLRAPVLGDARTAEELGRSFPRTRVRTSSGDRRARRASTTGPRSWSRRPGAEPVAEGGYAAVVLLDTWLLLARTDLRTAEEALRRWSNAAGLVRPGGRVVVVGDAGPPGAAGAGALGPGRLRRPRDRGAAWPRTCRRRPGWPRSAASRAPSTTRSRCSTPPPGAEVLGPVPAAEGSPASSSGCPAAQGAALSRALGDLQRLRSSRKLDAVRIQVDPPTIG